MSDQDDIREIIEDALAGTPEFRVMGEAETTAFFDQMKAAHDAQPDEPDVLPPAHIDWTPTAAINNNSWDGGDDPLRLLTPAEFEKVPDGDMLISISNKAKVKGRDYIDQDQRFGYIAWGYRDSQLTGGDDEC